MKFCQNYYLKIGLTSLKVVIFVKLWLNIFTFALSSEKLWGKNLDKISANLSGERIQAHHGPLVLQ